MKTGIRLLSFLLIGVFLTVIFINSFSLHFDSRMNEFHKLKKNSADVLVFGSSHVYRNVDPTVLYEEYGITGFDLGSAGQWISLSYYQMKEALRTQHPKVIIFEVYKAYYTNDYPETSGVTLKAIAGMNSLQNKMDAIKSTVEDPDEYLDFLFGFPVYHSRYNEMTLKDIRFTKPKTGNQYLGYVPLMTVKPAEVLDPSYITERRELSEKTIHYLDKMYELARENGCDLLFCLTPYSLDYEKRQPYYNALEDYALEKGIPFLNMNYYLDEIGIDGDTDFGTSRHLSVNGARKATMFLGNYLKENYELVDHRGDEMYAEYAEISRQMHEKRIQGTNDTDNIEDDVNDEME